MKKLILITLMALILALGCSCVEEIDADIPELGPMQTETKPSSADPVPTINPDDLPDTTDPSDNDPTDPDDPDDPDNPDVPVTPVIDDITFTENEEAQTSTLSGYISNKDYSTEGDVTEKYVSGATTVYKVCYGRTLTFVVEVTKKADTVKVDAYLEHYRFYMSNEKYADITIGDFSGRVSVPPVEWDENVSARTLIASAEAPKGDGGSIEISVKMPFGGKYHDESIENLEFSTDYYLN